MKYNSSLVKTNQTECHSDLFHIVKKNRINIYKKPISKHNKIAYEHAISKATSKKIIFDSGCGIGTSTRKLSNKYPDCFIIGIDKSESRIKKFLHYEEEVDENFCIIRADLVDFWRLATEDGLKLQHHFIFYPNPWPKKNHIKRRWHGSPVFKNIVQLGGNLELRSNWEIYVNEFSLALTEYGLKSHKTKLAHEMDYYSTEFEEKYHNSNHDLWKLTTNINNVF